MDFDAAWRAFLRRDAARSAPPTLEARVLAALAAAPRPPRRRRRAWLAVAGPMAAALLLAIEWQPAPSAPPPLAATSPSLTAALATYRSTVVSTAPGVGSQPAGLRAGRAIETRAVPRIARYGEALQVVRFRVPREALLSLGLTLIEPDTQAVVDVDVVVGEDGLPLDIRPLRTSQEH